MKIGVFGDSFSVSHAAAHDLPNTSWVKVLADRGLDITNHGKTGTSAWWSYTEFLKHYHNYSHIIFMYSHFFRISTTSPELISNVGKFHSVELLEQSRMFNNLSQKEKADIKQLTEANLVIEKTGKAVQLQMFVQQQIFNQVNTICDSNNIKLINIDIFSDQKKHSCVSNENSTGSFFYNLFDVGRYELTHTNDNVWHGDRRCCHLNKHNNVVLADILLETLYQGCDRNIAQNLFEHPGFVYD